MPPSQDGSLMTSSDRKILLALVDAGIKASGIKLYTKFSGTEITAAHQSLLDIPLEDAVVEDENSGLEVVEETPEE